MIWYPICIDNYGLDLCLNNSYILDLLLEYKLLYCSWAETLDIVINWNVKKVDFFSFLHLNSDFIELIFEGLQK